MFVYIMKYILRFFTFGVYTFKYKQSSSPKIEYDLWLYCKHGLGKIDAFQIPSHVSNFCGAYKCKKVVYNIRDINLIFPQFLIIPLLHVPLIALVC